MVVVGGVGGGVLTPGALACDAAACIALARCVPVCVAVLVCALQASKVLSRDISGVCGLSCSCWSSKWHVAFWKAAVEAFRSLPLLPGFLQY